VAAAIWIPPAAGIARPPLRALAAISVALGVGAPAAMGWLIQPLVDQLQGGLTPYGGVNIWPWVGLASSDAANTPVASLPSFAIALLMLVLGALAYVIARLAGQRDDEPQGVPQPLPEARDDTTAHGHIGVSTLLHDLAEDVPWLGLLLGNRSRAERPRGDSD
jgi:hypothetical protein